MDYAFDDGDDDEAFLAAALEAERMALGAPPVAAPAAHALPAYGGAAPVGEAAAAQSTRGPAAAWSCAVCGSGNGDEADRCSTCTSLRPGGAPAPAPAPARPAPARVPAKAPAPPVEQRALGAFFAPAPPPRVEPAEAPPVDADGLAECPGATAGLRIDPVAALTYVYPAQREQRKYQLSITRKALFTNTLVCLPTGLGKTLIAAVLMYNFYRWFPKGKVVFLAPTRPLVQQQAEACRLSLGIPRKDMCELTGSSRKDGDGRRGGLWAAHRVFFATPQTFANDLRDGVCPAASIVALVLDEAHRATGQYAYVTAVRHLTDAGVRFRLLALSATPGTTGDAVQSVLRNLHIGAVEYRSEEDADVAPYTFRRQVDLRVVQPTATMRDLEKAYSDGFKPMVEELGRMGVIHNAYDFQALLVSPFTFVAARKALQANETLQGVLGPRVGRAHFLLTACGLLSRGLQQLQSEGVKAALDYILMRKEDFDKVNSPDLNKVLRDLQSAAAGGESHAPKLAELIKVLREHFTAAASGAGPGGEASASTRAIVFTSARESVRHIIEELKELQSCGVAASEFVGQGDSNAKGSGRERKKGQTQVEQTAILAKFRKGELNVIVATCIGEEGLDVPQVDLVVFMDAVGIIRLVQRMGRTGRARDGRVVVLAAAGKEEKAWNTKNAESARMAEKLRAANMHFELCGSCPRMVPHRYTPEIELRQIVPDLDDDEDDEPLPVPAAARAAPKAKKARVEAPGVKSKKITTFYLSESDEEKDEDEPLIAAPKPAPRRVVAKAAKALPMSSDDDGEESEEKAAGSDEEGADVPAVEGEEDWMLAAEAAAAAREAEPREPVADVAQGVLLFAAALGGAASPLQPLRASQRPPRPLFASGAPPAVTYDAAGHVCIQPPRGAAGPTPPPPSPVPEVIEVENSPPPPHFAAAAAQHCSPMPPPRASQRSQRAAAAPPPDAVIDLTDSPDVQDGDAHAALSPRASAEERRRALLRQSMPPPPPPRRTSTPVDVAGPASGPSSGHAPSAGLSGRTVTPVPSGAALMTIDSDGSPAAAEPADESPPVAAAAFGRRITSMGGSGLDTGGSAPLRVRRVLKKKRKVLLRDSMDSDDAPAAAGGGPAASEDADPFAGAPAQPRRKRLVRKGGDASQEPGAAGAAPRGRAAAGAKPKAKRRAAAMYFDEEAGLSSGAEDSGDEDVEDGEEEDDSFVTDGTGEPESEGGRAMYHRLMVTPDSGRASGGAPRFAGPPVRGPAYRLANVRAMGPVADSPSPGWLGGVPRVESSDIDTPVSRDADADDEDEEEDAEAGAAAGGDDPNEDWCRVCRDGGNLMCCDGCEAAYHPRCLNLPGVPADAWFCPDCVAAQEATAIDDFDFGDPGFDLGTAPSAPPSAPPPSAAPPSAPIEVVTIDDDSSDDDAPNFDLGLL